jgi:UDP-glucuronate 4-epimerase
VLVTGAAGFLGSHTVEALLQRRQRVVGVDNFDAFYSRAAKARNIDACRATAQRTGGAFELVEADIADAGAMGAVFQRTRPEGVVHLAAKAGVRPSIQDPAGYARTNVTGTAVVLQQAQGVGCRRVVLASSSSVYGNNSKVPFAETDDVSQPISPYAATKAACELIAHAHHGLTRMPVACLRYFTAFGPRQRPDLAIARFLSRVGLGEPIDVYGDGSSSRDYTYVDDIVTGTLGALDRIEAFGFRIWNLGSDRPTRLDEVVRIVGQVAGRRPEVRCLSPQPGDVERTWADLTRARADLGYSPRTPLEEGMRRQWAWLKAESTA